MRKRPLYQAIASRVQAMANCAKTGNAEWLTKHREAIDHMVRNHLPSGSGIDTGTHFGSYKGDGKPCTPNRLIFSVSYHHLNDAGMYDGWTEHEIVVTPDLASGFDLNITGRDRNAIKDYLAELYQSALSAEIEE